VIRPGPDAIEAGLAPGGLVFHLYRIGDHELLAVDLVGPVGRGPASEVITAALESRVPTCLVCYDGDTGARFTPDQYAHAGLATGQPL